jgi:enoyl-[acyl-carrier protein] reductase I
MGLFDGKKGVIIGVFNEHSLAWAIADQVLLGGGQCAFTYMPDKPEDEKKRNHRRVDQIATPRGAKLLIPMDATKDEDIKAVADKLAETWGKIDFVLHSIAFAPPADLKGDTIATSREGFKLAMEISCYSLIAVSNALKGILNPGGSILTMTYFGGEKAVPGYNVMGICKAALDSTVKYLAYDLGPQAVRVNAVSAGPMKTVSGKGAGVDDMLPLYEAVAPLGRNVTHEEVGKSGAFLLSTMSDGITGEILHVDSGYNIMGSPGRAAAKLKPPA